MEMSKNDLFIYNIDSMYILYHDTFRDIQMFKNIQPLSKFKYLLKQISVISCVL